MSSKMPIPDYPFTTDGCSVVADLDMYECCVEHDRAYWMGGSSKERAAADRKFRECIQKTSRYKGLAWIRWFGVRIGGVSWLPTPFRWGYGWKYPRSGP